MTWGQREWNLQPTGIFDGDGISPSSFCALVAASGLSDGIAENRAFCMGDVATQTVFVLERPQLDGSR